MARAARKPVRRATEQPFVVGIPSENPPVPDGFEDREAETIATIKAAFADDETAGAEWKCSVYRIVPGSGGKHVREIWLFNCAPLDLLVLRETLASEWGAGRYRARVIRDLIPWKQYDVEIELSAKAARAFAEANRTPVAPPPTPPAAAPGTDAVTAAILASLERQGQLIDQLAQRLAAPPAPAFGMRDFVETLTQWQSLIPKAPDPFAQFEQAMALAEKIAGARGDRDTGFLDVVRDLVPVVTEALKRPGAAPGGPAADFAGAPSPQPAPLTLAPHVARPPNMAAAQHAAPAASSPSDPALASAAQQLAGVMDHLLKQAAAGVQPNLVSDWVNGMMPQVVFDWLETQQDPLTALAQYYPGINSHRAWFQALLESLYEPEEVAAAGAEQQPVNGVEQQPVG